MSSRVAGAGLALIAVALLAVSVATPVVLPAQLSLFAGHPTVADHVRETQDVYVGFYSAELCNSGGDGTCRSGDASNLYLGFRVSGYAELGLTAVLMVAAIALALMTLRRSEQRKTAAVLIWIAGVLALVGAGAMIWQGPFPGASAPLGIGMALHGAGIAGAMIAGVLARRRPPPIRLRVAERATQAVAPLPPPHAYDRRPPRAEEPLRADRGFDPRATEPRPRPAAPDAELSDPFASPFTGDRPPFSAQQLRPLYEAAPTHGGTGGLLPIERPPMPMHPPTAMSRTAIGVPPAEPMPPPFPADEPRRPPSPSAPPTFGEAHRPALPFAGEPRPALPFAGDARAMPPPIAGELRPVPRSAHDEPTAMAPPVMAALGADEPVAMGPPMAVAAGFDEPRPMATLPPSGELRPPAPSLPPPLPMGRGKPPSVPPPLPLPGAYAPMPPPSAPSAVPPPPGSSAPFAVPPPPGTSAPFAVPGSSAPFVAPPPGAAAAPFAPMPPGPPTLPGAPMAPAGPVPPAPYKARTQVSLVPPMPDNDLPIAPPTAQIVPDPITGTEPTLFPRAETPLAPPPAPAALPPRLHRESQLPPHRAQRESQLPPPRPHRESQLPPRAHRDSQLAPPPRVAVPMPARPSPSPTRPPVPTTLRGAPARPTIATTVPPIPPIPAIPPMPVIPAPTRAQTDVTDPDARALTGDVDPATASRIPVEVDDYTSQTNVSTGAPSSEEINAAVDGPGALDGRGAPGGAGTALPTSYVLDTSPTGEPVAAEPPAAAAAPPDVAAIASRPTIQIPEQRPSPILPIVVPPAISPVRDRSMPKLPISTAPDSLPPPKDTKQAIGPSPACPQCESPMAWVEEHLRFYCKSCRMYF